MIELPLPVSQYGIARVPYLGGIYLYATPFFLVRRGIAAANKDEILWTYAHPYDFDREEKFSLMSHTSFCNQFRAVGRASGSREKNPRRTGLRRCTAAGRTDCPNESLRCPNGNENGYQPP